MPLLAAYPTAVSVLMLAALVFAARPAFAAGDGAEPATPSKLFASEAPLSVTLSAPWREFARHKDTKTSYPATLEYIDESAAKHSVPVAVATRGHNRMKVCRFPPIKLIFEKQAVRETPFRGNKSLKLVTRCDNDERSEQYLLKEILAYRIYNLVTERSFKARPLSITYVDTAEHSSDSAHFAFLIEDDSDLARRNGLEKLAVTAIDPEQLDPLEASRMALFEYLIGNTDFAVLNALPGQRCCHNSVLIGADAASSVFAVPYDFDSSGLVDTHYSVPNSVLKIRSNRERVYRGFCASNAALETARREFLQLEPRIRELARSERGFVAASREAVEEYLSKGFDVLRDDARFARDVTAKCRK